MALNGGYYFRWIGRQLATENRAVSAASYDGSFCITAPSSSKLPGGGATKSIQLIEPGTVWGD